MEVLFRIWTSTLATYVEAAAAVVIGFAAAEAIVRASTIFIRPARGQEAKEAVRQRLGRWLSVALEFELAADILRMAVTPTWNDLGKLAAQEIDRAVVPTHGGGVLPSTE